jgi:putative PIN family toxin of toxin-antitoxin system
VSDRAVFDCMLYLQAVTNETGPAFACFRLVEDGTVILCVSEAVLAEVRDVLSRPKLLVKFPHLTPERVEAFLENVRAWAIPVTEVPAAFSYPRDHDDEPYINLALAAKAKYLVSRDKDILDLATDADFHARFPDVIILNPVAFLREISSQGQGEQGGSNSP